MTEEFRRMLDDVSQRRGLNRRELGLKLEGAGYPCGRMAIERISAGERLEEPPRFLWAIKGVLSLSEAEVKELLYTYYIGKHH